MTDLNSVQVGDGKPIVLIHGFPLNQNVWTTFSQALAKYAKVITLDLPGFGKSAALKENFSITDVAQRVLDWLDENKVEDPVVVGHSLGGYVALAMAELKPDRIAGFVLFHSTAYADSSEKKESRSKVIEFIEKNGVQTFTSNFIPPLFMDQKHPGIELVRNIAITSEKRAVIGYTLAMRDRPDRTSVLKQFPKPILIIAGDKDAGIPVTSLMEQAALSPLTSLHVLTESAHMGMLEQPSESIEALRYYLGKVTDR